jgi:hypothetical protein
MGKSIQTDGGADPNTDAPLGRLAEFPAGYSLTGLLSSLPPPLHQPESILLQGKPNLGTTFSERNMNTIALKIKTV